MQPSIEANKSPEQILKDHTTSRETYKNQGSTVAKVIIVGLLILTAISLAVLGAMVLPHVSPIFGAVAVGPLLSPAFWGTLATAAVSAVLVAVLLIRLNYLKRQLDKKEAQNYAEFEQNVQQAIERELAKVVKDERPSDATAVSKETYNNHMEIAELLIKNLEGKVTEKEAKITDLTKQLQEAAKDERPSDATTVPKETYDADMTKAEDLLNEREAKITDLTNQLREAKNQTEERVKELTDEITMLHAELAKAVSQAPIPPPVVNDLPPVVNEGKEEEPVIALPKDLPPPINDGKQEETENNLLGTSQLSPPPASEIPEPENINWDFVDKIYSDLNLKNGIHDSIYLSAQAAVAQYHIIQALNNASPTTEEINTIIERTREYNVQARQNAAVRLGLASEPLAMTPATPALNAFEKLLLEAKDKLQHVEEGPQVKKDEGLGNALCKNILAHAYMVNVETANDCGEESDPNSWASASTKMFESMHIPLCKKLPSKALNVDFETKIKEKTKQDIDLIVKDLKTQKDPLRAALNGIRARVVGSSLLSQEASQG